MICTCFKTIVKPACILLSIAILTAASGCGANKLATDPTPPPLALEGVNLRVVNSYGPNNGAHMVFEKLCEEFEASTGAEIANEATDSTEEWKQNVLDMFIDGDEPDVLFFFTGSDVNSPVQAGKFVSFDEIREKHPDYASNINLMVLDSMKASDGKDYAVPIKGYWERLFVNKDIFDELALKLPRSYKELLETAPKLLEAGYIPIAASLNEVPHYLFEAFLYNETGPSSHLNVPSDPDDLPESWIKALDRFYETYSAGMYPDEADSMTHADAFELFQSKKAAMIVDGDWSVAFVRDTENVIVIDFPAGDSGARKNTDLISGFSMGFYISRKAWDDQTKREAAIMFVQHITSNNSIMRLNVSGAAMPISVGASDSAVSGAGEDAAPLLLSIEELNKKTTAFVGAVADSFRPEARAWLFERILPLAKGELDSAEVLREFIELNNN